MKSKYDITNLLKNKPMNAAECARIMISDLHEEKETGKGFLTKEEIISIRDGKQDNSAYYNDLIEIDQNIELMLANTNQKILNYKILTLKLEHILESYIHTMYQEDVIGCVQWIEGKSKKMSKDIHVLKNTLKYIFRLTSIYAYLGDMYKDLKREDLSKANINNSKEVIVTIMQKRRRLLESVLAYREIMAKGSEKTKNTYYLETLNILIESIEVEDIPLKRNLLMLHNHFTFKKYGYDGFLQKEMDIEVKAKYGDEHESFLEN